MNIYEQYGRLQEAYETECERHRTTVGILRQLKNGELSLEALTVTNDNQWAIIPKEAITADPLADESPAN
jgi:hypothetical protein